MLADNGQTAQREVFLNQIGGEDEDEQRIDKHCCPEWEQIVGCSHATAEYGCQYHIDHDFLDVIVNRKFLLSYHIREYHGGTITSYTSPCTAHITVLRYQYHIDHNWSCL